MIVAFVLTWFLREIPLMASSGQTRALAQEHAALETEVAAVAMAS